MKLSSQMVSSLCCRLTILLTALPSRRSRDAKYRRLIITAVTVMTCDIFAFLGNFWAPAFFHQLAPSVRACWIVFVTRTLHLWEFGPFCGPTCNLQKQSSKLNQHQ